MSEDAFLVAIKSTIDKLGNDLALAQTPPARFVDLDDSTAVEEVMTSEDDAIIWELSTFEDSPADPLYLITFNIGARTTQDAANYDILRLTGKIRRVFKIGESTRVKDYSGAVASDVLGSFTVISVSVNPQAFDRTSGLRLITVVARAQRWQ